MATKKKSPILPIIIVVALLALAGIGWYLMKGKGTMGSNSAGSAFSSIKDALSKSVSLKCEFDENGTHTVTYIKNGAIRADMTNPNPEQSGSMIMKEKKMYFWNEKEGYVMEIPDYKDVEVTESEKPSQSEDFMKELETYKDKCKADVVSDSLFTPPSDVTFSDMSQMMPSGMPKVDENGQMSEEDVQKYMQQYQQGDYSDQ